MPQISILPLNYIYLDKTMNLRLIRLLIYTNFYILNKNNMYILFLMLRLYLYCYI